MGLEHHAQASATYEVFTVTYPTFSTTGTTEVTSEDGVHAATGETTPASATPIGTPCESPATQSTQRSASVSATTTVNTAADADEGRTPSSHTYDELGPKGFRNLMEILEEAAVPPGAALQFAGAGVDAELCLLGTEGPVSHVEARKEPSWRRAMEEELDSIRGNDTWLLVDLPPGQKPIGLKWVYKLKKDPSGAIVKHKARLVAKGYVQREGVDFDELFAPVARMETVRLLVPMAALEGWRLHHMDVKSAFLNGELQEEVFVRQPPGYDEAGNEHKVLKLNKVLYGLRQAPRALYAKLHATLLTLGFERCPLEHTVYMRSKGGSRLLVGVYVDNLVITGASQEEIDSFKEQMKNLFKMSDLGLLSYYLGIEVAQTTNGVTLSKAGYAQKILEKVGMAECNPSQVPMEPRL